MQVYYVTDGGDVKVLSPSKTEVETVNTNSEALFAIAYDTIRNKIYWTSMYQIYRCDANSCGGSVETILKTSYRKPIVVKILQEAHMTYRVHGLQLQIVSFGDWVSIT